MLSDGDLASNSDKYQRRPSDGLAIQLRTTRCIEVFPSHDGSSVKQSSRTAPDDIVSNIDQPDDFDRGNSERSPNYHESFVKTSSKGSLRRQTSSGLTNSLRSGSDTKPLSSRSSLQNSSSNLYDSSLNLAERDITPIENRENLDPTRREWAEGLNRNETFHESFSSFAGIPEPPPTSEDDSFWSSGYSGRSEKIRNDGDDDMSSKRNIEEGIMKFDQSLDNQNIPPREQDFELPTSCVRSNTAPIEKQRLPEGRGNTSGEIGAFHSITRAFGERPAWTQADHSLSIDGVDPLFDEDVVTQQSFVSRMSHRSVSTAHVMVRQLLPGEGKGVFSRRRGCVLCCLLLFVAVAVAVGVAISAQESNTKADPTEESDLKIKPACTVMAKMEMPDIPSQCACRQLITNVSDVASANYGILQKMIEQGLLGNDTREDSTLLTDSDLMWRNVSRSDCANVRNRVLWDMARQNNTDIERYALAALYSDVGVKDWSFEEAIVNNTSTCDWHGVSCKANGTAVERVSLDFAGQIVVVLPIELGLLTNLGKSTSQLWFIFVVWSQPDFVVYSSELIHKFGGPTNLRWKPGDRNWAANQFR